MPRVLVAETFFAGVLWSKLIPDTLKKVGFMTWLLDIKPSIAFLGHTHYAFKMFEKGSLRVLSKTCCHQSFRRSKISVKIEKLKRKIKHQLSSGSKKSSLKHDQTKFGEPTIRLYVY